MRVADALLVAGADPNATTLDGDTALMMASSQGYAEIVRGLLAMGANVHAENRYGDNAMDLAVEEGHLNVARQLLKAR
jgi:ankyrin repeat protein